MTKQVELKDKIELKSNIQRRLKRIEGQLRGIQRMINENVCCTDVIIQVAAIRAAVSKVGVLILENHIQECLAEALEGEDKDKALRDLIYVMNNFIR